MRRALCILVFGALAAIVGLGSARAGGAGTTTTADTTTTGTTTTTPAPSYAPLPLSSLPASCVPAGAAAVVLPSHPVIALGTPASTLGPSAYSESSASIVAFNSSTVSGSTCASTNVRLDSLSLFDGAVTASSVEATNGNGAVAGLAIDGTTVPATNGQTVAVQSWGQLTLGATAGRLKAPLILRLREAHDSLPAGTAIVVAFAASAHPPAKPNHRQSRAIQKQRAGSSRSPKHSATTHRSRKHRRHQPQKPPPDYPASPSPLAANGGLTDAAQDNPIVSLAMKYLGIPYQWGGASPQTGFDCSGLVKYVFAQLGVPLVHFAASQWHTPNGVWVAPNRLQAGDLVFFVGSDGTRKEPGHVGIYIGDGYLIDAPHTGAFVRIDRLTEPRLAKEYVGARRITSPLHEVRHLAHAIEHGASATPILTGFPPPITTRLLSEPVGFDVTSTAAVRAGSRGYWIWTGVSLGGALLLLIAGGLVVRRRLPLDARPSNEPST
jgi:cell wall-associated NlpC family hydrolase